MVRREKLNWVYLTTFQYVYSTYWTNSLLVEIYNVNTANSSWFKHIENIFIFQNAVLFLRTVWTQIRTSELSLCTISNLNR